MHDNPHNIDAHAAPPVQQPAYLPEKKGRRMPFIIGAIIIIAIVIWGVGSRMRDEDKLTKETNEIAIPIVGVMQAKPGAATEDVVLPGTVQSWHDAPIYARTNGYLRSWNTDIGARVKNGDVLAEIDTPDVDAQLHQAQAGLLNSEANNALAQSTAQRWLGLLKTNSVSKQEADEKVAAAEADAAQVAAAKANLDRLQQLEDFKHVVAPFDGVITARNTDNGQLISAGSNGSAQELFHISDLSKLRIYVRVPENYVAAVKPDLKAKLYFPQYPDRAFEASLDQTANALDPTTRSLLIELIVDNSKGELLPGGYTESHIEVPTPGDNIHLPVNTILFRDGTKVAVIDQDGKHVKLKTISIGRDYGKTVEVLAGVDAGDQVVVNPPDSLGDGQEVRIAKDGDKDSGDKKSADKTNGDTKADDKKTSTKDATGAFQIRGKKNEGTNAQGSQEINGPGVTSKTNTDDNNNIPSKDSSQSNDVTKAEGSNNKDPNDAKDVSKP